MAPAPSKQTKGDSETTAELQHLRTRYNLRPPKPSSCPPRSLAVESVAGRHGPSMIGNAHQWHPFQKAPSKTPHKPACKLARKPAHKPARKPACKLARKPACKAARKPA
ncbi:hypothetical protein PCASD_03365 [Puccinia coronata f. sp. avenae]|uniref:Uncharacterized protein n=1 Tax=Puccinia coronata f. sp. avenae TaxID=200324 RepID=A0A2N5VF57_9BASI|nr:hypothetical protein PCASD_03365 [Puccinia coronata f. sp. avenae]